MVKISQQLERSPVPDRRPRSGCERDAAEDFARAAARTVVKLSELGRLGAARLSVIASSLFESAP